MIVRVECFPYFVILIWILRLTIRCYFRFLLALFLFLLAGSALRSDRFRKQLFCEGNRAWPGQCPRETGRKIAARSLHERCWVLVESAKTVGFWVEAYLTAAVRGIRSEEVAGKIARHLGRFADWMADGWIAVVTAREVTGWREHLAATGVRTLADGRQQVMAPATVNNHLAHLSALFTADGRARPGRPAAAQ